MKSIKKTVIALALVTLTGVAIAQTKPGPARAHRQEKTQDLTPDERASKEAEKMTQKLSLSDEQRKAWFDAAKERHSLNQPLREKMRGSTTPEERQEIRKQVRANDEAFDRKVTAFLKADQKAKLDEHRKKRHAEHRRPGKGNPRPERH